MVRKSNDGSDEGGDRIRRRSELRRLEILRAAARVFRRQGYAATGMRDIAAEADLSPGNLYHYFSGKHEILYFCQDRALERMLASIDEAIRQESSTPARLRRVIEAHVRCVLDELEGSAAHLEIDALPPRSRSEIVAKRDRYESAIRELLTTGTRERELEPCDEVLVTRAILGACNWTARWYHPGGPRSAAAVADALAEFLVRGLVGGQAVAAASPPSVPAPVPILAGFPRPTGHPAEGPQPSPPRSRLTENAK